MKELHSKKPGCATFRNDQYMSPIEHLIVKTGDDAIDCIKYLYEETKAGQDQERKEGLTLLHQAAIFGNVNICQYLLERGVDVNEGDNSGRTALMMATLMDKVCIFKS